MSNKKPYLVFMTGPNSIENLREMIEPIKQYFRGVCALVHDSNEFSPEVEYLTKINNELGEGNIILGSFVGRHDHSRNRILFETGIKNGDYLVTLDTLERIPEVFAKNLFNLMMQMNHEGVDVIYYFSKPYVIKYREDMEYKGTPHESLVGKYSISSVELTLLNEYFKDENNVRINVRPIKRPDKFHFIGHYAKYLLQPNSNQILLGLENQKHPQEMWSKREENRLRFIKTLEDRGFDRSFAGVLALFSGPIDDELKHYINNEKVWQDVYRYYILKDDTVIDEHSWISMKKF
jgi:hypothetical protein